MRNISELYCQVPNKRGVRIVGKFGKSSKIKLTSRNGKGVAKIRNNDCSEFEFSPMVSGVSKY